MVEFMPTDGPGQFAYELAEIKRRLSELETSRRLPFSEFYDDAGNVVARFSADGLEFFDELGGRRVRLGPQDGSFGLSVLSGSGISMIDVLDDGIHWPYLTVPVVALQGDYEVVTSATFTPTHRGQIESVSHEGLFCWVYVLADAGTTGEFRLRNLDTGAVTGTVAAPTAVPFQFRWLHGSDLGTGPVAFDVEARRTGGAGQIRVYRSFGMSMTGPGLCFANGVPSV